MQKTSLHVATAGLVLLAAGTASAAPAKEKADERADLPPVDLTHFEVDEADPVGNLPSADEINREPLRFANMLNDLSARIDDTHRRADWKQAVKYDQAWTLMAPHDAKSFATLCEDAEAAGMRDEALRACGQAIQKEGVTVAEFARFVRLVNARPGGVDPTELEDARNAIDHLKSEPTSRLLALQLQCELSLTITDDRKFEECANALIELAPDDPTSITYAWTLAVKERNAARARELIERARQSEKLKGAVPTMEKNTAALLPDATNGKTGQALRWLLGLAIALATVLFVARRFTRATSSA